MAAWATDARDLAKGPLSGSPLHYYMDGNTDSSDASAIAKSPGVRAYNDVTGDNFRLYFVGEGAACPVTRPRIVGYVCP